MQKMKNTRIFVNAGRIVLLCACSCLLTSCSMISNLLGSLISLPFRILDYVLPG